MTLTRAGLRGRVAAASPDELRALAAALAQELVLAYDLLGAALELACAHLEDCEVELRDQSCFWAHLHDLDRFTTDGEYGFDVWIISERAQRIDPPTTSLRAEIEGLRRELAREPDPAL